MDTDEVKKMYARLEELVNSGQTDAAHEYLTNHLPLLPQEVQDDILVRLFMQGAIDEAAEIEALDELQEEVLETGEELLKAKNDLDQQAK